LALLYLLLGQFEPGWKLYEWRKLLPAPHGARTFDQPAWIGQNLQGKTLFIHFEQGLGDIFQFCRYVGLADQQGARVVFSVPDALVELMGTLSPSIEIIGDDRAPDHFDYHCALMSLPLAFGANAQNVPAPGGYLAADETRAAVWRDRLGVGGFRIGIVWQGNTLEGDNSRACPLSMFENVSRLPGVRLISMQKGGGSNFQDCRPMCR
jgi:hypothetical protein